MDGWEGGNKRLDMTSAFAIWNTIQRSAMTFQMVQMMHQRGRW